MAPHKARACDMAMLQKATVMTIKNPVDTKNVMCDSKVEFKNKIQMNKKLLTLLALASFSNMKAVAEGCAPETPWAAQNNVMLVGASLGVASMKDPISARTDWNSNTPINGDASFNMTGAQKEAMIPSGYQSNISNLKASAAKMGFAGRLDVQYGMRQGMFGAFLYAGLGLNQSKTTANADSVNGLGRCQVYESSAADGAVNITSFQNAGTEINNFGPFVKESYANPRVTITSGLNFQAGARMGVWVNNMFFHGIVGWQCLNLQSKVSDVYKAFELKTTIVNTGTDLIGVREAQEGLKTCSFTKNKWTNALVLGAGIDVAHQKWTYGFYYQAAICQRTNFQYDNFVVGATQNTVTKETNVNGNLGTQQYEKSKATVSTKPVISTFMMTVKYAFHKA
jgi:hypothetical protein